MQAEDIVRIAHKSGSLQQVEDQRLQGNGRIASRELDLTMVAVAVSYTYRESKADSSV